MPKVSSLIHGVRWVNWRVSVLGWIHEFTTMYIPPAKLKKNTVKANDFKTFITTKYILLQYN